MQHLLEELGIDLTPSNIDTCAKMLLWACTDGVGVLAQDDICIHEFARFARDYFKENYPKELQPVGDLIIGWVIGQLAFGFFLAPDIEKFAVRVIKLNLSAKLKQAGKDIPMDGDNPFTQFMSKN